MAPMCAIFDEMELRALVEASARVASTRSRKEKLERLATLLRSLTPEERPVGAHFLAGEIRQGRIGIGYATIAKTTTVPPADTSTLSLLDVDRSIEAIVETRGAGSSKRRLELLEKLLSRATEAEQSYLRRLLIGELRQGALEGLLLEAVAQAAELPSDVVRRARMLSGDVGAVVLASLSEGLTGLQRFSLTPFTPVHPMLAGSAQGIDEALERLGEAAFEVKLDGARVQVHKDGDEVRVYSRKLNEVTSAVPEVVEATRAMAARRMILDGETIALDPSGYPRPFQTTMRRYGRRLDVDDLRAEIPLSTFFFDLLLVDDQSLLDASTEARVNILDELVDKTLLIPRLRTRDAEAADEFWAEALHRGHEGVMAKALDAPYEAGHRGSSWLKLKPVHTLDLVVVAAEWGSGRRQGWLSNLHLAARDPNSASFVMLGKTFKGLTDAVLQWQTQALLEREIGRDGHIVHVRPELVVEIAFDGLQQSPHYPGGLALRFARVKGYRRDKSAQQANTIEEVRKLHARS